MGTLEGSTEWIRHGLYGADEGSQCLMADTAAEFRAWSHDKFWKAFDIAIEGCC